MGIVNNRECCYWGKKECKWEHCKEITGYNIAHSKDGDIIIKEKLCGSKFGQIRCQTE